MLPGGAGGQVQCKGESEATLCVLRALISWYGCQSDCWLGDCCPQSELWAVHSHQKDELPYRELRDTYHMQSHCYGDEVTPLSYCWMHRI